MSLPRVAPCHYVGDEHGVAGGRRRGLGARPQLQEADSPCCLETTLPISVSSSEDPSIFFFNIFIGV